MHQRKYEFAPVWVLRNVVSALDIHCWMLCVILAPRTAGMSSMRMVERSIDTILASFLLLLCAPVLIGISALVVTDGGPVFIVSLGTGRHGLPCGLLSFRTTFIDADDMLSEYCSYNPDAAAEWTENQRLKFDPRVTPVGNLLRPTGLQCLPRLLNVIRGERPLLLARVADGTACNDLP
jgi:lipopolysaccharide/colanic/teichoic acid biosynthesis glycosyltransferase